jgi:glycosyltransferase involved in cell wall biosynthesis
MFSFDSLPPLKDAVRHSRCLRHAAGMGWLMRGLLASDSTKRVACLTRSLALLEGRRARQRAGLALARSPGYANPAPWEAVTRSTPRYARLLQNDPRLTRTIMLKAPGADGEKGVLLLYFEYNWARLLHGLDAAGRRWLDENYDIVLSTSWSPTDYAMLGMAVSCLQSDVFVQSCNYGEIPDIEALHSRLRCLESLPCDWINPAFYSAMPAQERTTDIVMVANWGEFKRHWEFFRALRHMPPELKIVLIGQREGGRGTDTIRALARTHGVPQQLEIYESLPIAEVARHQCKAKVSVIMTLREGCCVAAVESLFAGCALAMREDAHVGPLAYINEHTGRRLRPGRLHQDLMALLEAVPRLRPQEWAVENLSCHVTHQKLNTQLRAAALSRGLPWTRDLALPHWRPYPRHANDQERDSLLPAYEELHRRFPNVFGSDLIDTSWK